MHFPGQLPLRDDVSTVQCELRGDTIEMLGFRHAKGECFGFLQFSILFLVHMRERGAVSLIRSCRRLLLYCANARIGPPETSPKAADTMTCSDEAVFRGGGCRSSPDGDITRLDLFLFWSRDC